MADNVQVNGSGNLVLIHDAAWIPTSGTNSCCCNETCATGKRCWLHYTSTYSCQGWSVATLTQTICQLESDPNPSPTVWTETTDCLTWEIWVRGGCCSVADDCTPPGVGTPSSGDIPSCVVPDDDDPDDPCFDCCHTITITVSGGGCVAGTYDLDLQGASAPCTWKWLPNETGAPQTHQLQCNLVGSIGTCTTTHWQIGLSPNAVAACTGQPEETCAWVFESNIDNCGACDPEDPVTNVIFCPGEASTSWTLCYPPSDGGGPCDSVSPVTITVSC